MSGVESRGSRGQSGRGLGVRGFREFKVGSGVQGETLSRTDSACLVFTEYHVKDTKPCYLIYSKIRESTLQRSESPGTLGKAS